MKIALSYHYDESQPHIWSTPSGLGKAFERAGHTVTSYGFDPTATDLSRLIRDSGKYDLIFFCLAGPSQSFDVQLSALRAYTKTPIFMETGDDIPQSNYHHKRIQYLDRIFTPDLRCHKYYASKGLPSVWMPCWCDTEVFYKMPNANRENACMTTCGDRPYTQTLQNAFKHQFINKRVWNYDNTAFFNSGTCTYQYARYDEITRRLFEAGGCGLAILTNRISTESGIYDLFEEDKDICYFTTEAEAIQKLDRLLTDTKFCAMIASNMYAKIQQSHLIDHRIETILSYL